MRRLESRLAALGGEPEAEDRADNFETMPEEPRGLRESRASLKRKEEILRDSKAAGTSADRIKDIEESVSTIRDNVTDLEESHLSEVFADRLKKRAASAKGKQLLNALAEAHREAYKEGGDEKRARAERALVDFYKDTSIERPSSKERLADRRFQDVRNISDNWRGSDELALHDELKEQETEARQVYYRHASGDTQYTQAQVDTAVKTMTTKGAQAAALKFAYTEGMERAARELEAQAQQSADNFETMPEVEAQKQAPEPEPDFESTLLQRDEPARPAPSGKPWVSEDAKTTHNRLRTLADDSRLAGEFRRFVESNDLSPDGFELDELGVFGVSEAQVLGAATLVGKNLGRGKKIKNGTAHDIDFAETGNKGYKVAWIKEKNRAGLGVRLTEGPFEGNHFIFKPVAKSDALEEMLILLRRMSEAGMLSEGDMPLDYLEDATDPRGFNTLNLQLAEIAQVFSLSDLLLDRDLDEIPREERAELVDEYGEAFVARVEGRLAKMSDDSYQSPSEIRAGVTQAALVADHYDDFLAESARAQAAHDEEVRIARQYKEEQQEKYAQRRQQEQEQRAQQEQAQRAQERRERRGDLGPSFLNNEDLITHDEARKSYIEALVPDAQGIREDVDALRGQSAAAIIAAAKTPLVAGETIKYTLPDGLRVGAKLDESSRFLEYQIQFKDGKVSELERVSFSDPLSPTKLKTLPRALLGSVYAGTADDGVEKYHTIADEGDIALHARRLARFKKLEDREREFDTFSKLTAEPRVQKDELDAITPRQDALTSASDIDKKTAAVLKRVIDPKQTIRNLDEAFRVGDSLVATDGHRIFVRRGMAYGRDGVQVSTGPKSIGGIRVSLAGTISSFIPPAEQEQKHVGTMSKETAAHVVAALKVGGARVKTVEPGVVAGRALIRADGRNVTIMINGRDVATFPQSNDGVQGDYAIGARYLSDALSGGGAVSLHFPPVKFTADRQRLYVPLRFDSMLGSMHVQPTRM